MIYQLTRQNSINVISYRLSSLLGPAMYIKKVK